MFLRFSEAHSCEEFECVSVVRLSVDKNDPDAFFQHGVANLLVKLRGNAGALQLRLHTEPDEIAVFPGGISLRYDIPQMSD